jgi:hypothetical protein
MEMPNRSYKIIAGTNFRGNEIGENLYGNALFLALTSSFKK